MLLLIDNNVLWSVRSEKKNCSCKCVHSIEFRSMMMIIDRYVRVGIETKS